MALCFAPPAAQGIGVVGASGTKPATGGPVATQSPTALPYYFAEPYSTNQRASIEPANKLLRQYLPKSIDLRFVSGQQCWRIAAELNNRPRKKLGYKTPKEVFFGDP